MLMMLFVAKIFADTCFFSVELPRYTNKASMREKILYAITNCHSIDTDHAAQNVDWDDES